MHKGIALSLVLISLTALCVAVTQPVKAQSQAPQLQWSKTYGPYEGQSVIQTSDGGYAIVGENASYLAHGYNLFYPLIIKTNSSGEQLWKSSYGAPFVYGLSASSVIQTKDGSYVLCGERGWLLKIDSYGAVLWNRTYRVVENSVNYFVDASAISITEGGYILIGITGDTVTGGYNTVLIKTDEEGNMLWGKVFKAGEGPIRHYDVEAATATETNNGYFIVGEWNAQAWLAKIDSNGNLLINRTYLDPPNLLGFTSIVVNQPEELVLSAYTQEYAPSINRNFIYTAVLMKSDLDGNVSWSRSYPDTSPFSQLQQTPDGGCVAFSGQNLIKINSFGDIIWNVSFSSIGVPNSFTLTEDGGYAVTGTSYSDSVQDIFLAKLSPEIESSPPPTPSISSSPTIPSPSPNPILTPSSSIPEFPTWIALPLLLTVAFAIILTKKLSGNAKR
jgi:hypothetical protein